MTELSKKSQTLVLAALLLFAFFLRFWNLGSTMQFQADQGRDAFIVAKTFLYDDPMFIGPVTSVGNMYLGPFYYYFMLPFLFLTYPSPIGPVYAVALVSVLGVLALYLLSKQWFGTNTALLTAYFAAVLIPDIYHARFSWNPNILPFTSILLLYCAYEALYKKRALFWIGVGICVSIMIQLHYVSLLAPAALLPLWLSTMVRSAYYGHWKHFKATLLFSSAAGVILVASIVPLVLFDLKHSGTNINSLSSLVGNSEHFAQVASDKTGRDISDVILETQGRSMQLFVEIVFGKDVIPRWMAWGMVATLLAVLIEWWYRTRTQDTPQQQQVHQSLSLVLMFILVAIAGLSFYRHSVFDHYLAHMYPIIALVYALFIVRITQLIPVLGKLVGVIAVVWLGYMSLRFVFTINPSWTVLDQYRTTTQIATHLKKDEEYTLVLVSDNRDYFAQSYRYFFSTTDHPPIAQDDSVRADTIVIINELEESFDPGGSPIYDLVVFPNKNPSERFRIEDGPEVLILRRE